MYASAMMQSDYNLSDIVTLYALVGRIRLTASKRVVEAAEAVAKLIVQRYGEPNVSFEELRIAALVSNADPLHNFSIACRDDLYSVAHGPAWT